MQIYAAFATVLALASHALADCSATVPNTDYKGNDIKSVDANSAADCCGPCQAEPTCTVFSFAYGKCYLKFGTPALIAANGVSTGTKATAAGTCGDIAANTDLQGNDLTSVAANSAADCCGPCQNTAKCTSFSFFQGVCYLKSGSPARIAKAGVSSGSVKSAVTPINLKTCTSTIAANTDYQGNDIGTATAASAAACCDPCSKTAGCTTFAFANGVCYLKSGSPARISKSGVSTGALAGAATTSACGAIYPNTDFKGADLSSAPAKSADDCCPLCQSNGACTGFSFFQGTCYLKYGPLVRVDAPWGPATGVVKATASPQCSAPEANVDYPGNDLARDTSITTADACCSLCTANAACQAYVVSKFGCSIKSKAENRQTGLDASWNVFAATRASVGNPTPAKLSSATASPNVRVAPLPYTYVAGAQWFAISKLESTDDEFQKLAASLNATTHVHGAKPESIISPAPDGTKVYPFTSVASIGECVALVASIGQTYFTYLADMGVCMGHQFTGTDKTFLLQANNQPAATVAQSLTDDFLLQPAGSVASDAACVDKCKATASCVAAKKIGDQCSLYGPAVARSASSMAGYVTSAFNANPVPNLPTFGNPSKVHFYTTAHQDDHELFMSNNFHKSIADPSTKVVFIYTTAGDDHGGDNWRTARELGTLAATKAWVDFFGKFNSDPKGDSVSINGHVISRVTIGNVVHYFFRVPEYGANDNTGFMALVNGERPVPPSDDLGNPYPNRDAFKQVLTAIYNQETQGINAIEMNAQDPEAPWPDHPMHLATGQLVWDIVNANGKWKTCVPQHYFFTYQKWFDAVNVDPVVKDVQRYAWMRLSQAIFNYDDTVLFWSEHSINLGRTYIRRTFNEGAGPCW
ncbi:Aste57867_1148 [Aphanomyces stellatus]|uniref:Aste57867_1148 protein n=1 Tax=Aphanomyces stellatus TaxID=120398 RepID=A0A485K5Q6_9STRA|nr:hypothetical protein As57867_001147 [Aphanomyces stellatus]VFT78368.1 Aste57867_1148 [Aphanomyces stellatus]